jgi:hypothetical protein
VIAEFKGVMSFVGSATIADLQSQDAGDARETRETSYKQNETLKHSEEKS